jgi:hypothetical protein
VAHSTDGHALGRAKAAASNGSAGGNGGGGGGGAMLWPLSVLAGVGAAAAGGAPALPGGGPAGWLGGGGAGGVGRGGAPTVERLVEMSARLAEEAQRWGWRRGGDLSSGQGGNWFGRRLSRLFLQPGPYAPAHKSARRRGIARLEELRGSLERGPAADGAGGLASAPGAAGARAPRAVRSHEDVWSSCEDDA